MGGMGRGLWPLDVQRGLGSRAQLHFGLVVLSVDLGVEVGEVGASSLRRETGVWAILEELVVLLEAVGARGGMGPEQVVGVGAPWGLLRGLLRGGDGGCGGRPCGRGGLAGVGGALAILLVLGDLVELLLAR